MATSPTDWVSSESAAQSLGIPADSLSVALKSELEGYIAAAIQYAEIYTGRDLLDRQKSVRNKCLRTIRDRVMVYGVYDWKDGTDVIIQYYKASDRVQADRLTMQNDEYQVEYDEGNYTLTLVPVGDNGNWPSDIDKFWLIQFSVGMEANRYPQMKTALQLIVNDLYNAVPMYTTTAKRTYDHFLDPLKRLTPTS